MRLAAQYSLSEGISLLREFVLNSKREVVISPEILAPMEQNMWSLTSKTTISTRNIH